MESHQVPTLVLVLILAFTLPALILFVAALQNLLKKCAPESRTTPPGIVWLLLIPVFGLAWQFFVVLNIAKTLRYEFARRGIPSNESSPGQTVGLFLSVCNLCIFIPLVGGLASIVCVVLWIVYWIKIADYSRLLDEKQTETPTSSIA